MNKLEKDFRILKADMDRYMNSYPYNRVYFVKGTSPFSYFINFWILFFKKQRWGFRTIFYYRIGRLSCLFSWLFRVYFKDTIISGPSTIAGGGIFFDHAFSTIINCEHIGYGCTFLQNTTFGAVFKDGVNHRPYLGNNVYVGANVVVIGGIHIGNNVIIGAGTVVTKSIPDNCTVVGNPARIIKKDSVKVDIPL